MYQLRNLTDSDKEAIIQGPLRVALLIAGADGTYKESEADRIRKIIHVKTYSEKSDVSEIYKILDSRNTLDEVNTILAKMPETWEDRSDALREDLAHIGKLLKKLDHVFAVQYYASLKSVAVNIANATGGIFGIGAIGEVEHELLTLPMIEKP